MRLLRELLGSRATGLTADELADAVAVSRNAVQQQLTALERELRASRGGDYDPTSAAEDDDSDDRGPFIDRYRLDP